MNTITQEQPKATEGEVIEELANYLAYDLIATSDLGVLVTNAEWDMLSKKWGREALEFVSGKILDEVERRTPRAPED